MKGLPPRTFARLLQQIDPFTNLPNAVIEDFSAGDRIAVAVRSDNGFVFNGSAAGFAGINVQQTAEGALVTLGSQSFAGKVLLLGVNATDVTADMFLFG